MGSDELVRALIVPFLAEAEELGAQIVRGALALEREALGGPKLAPAYEEVARGLHTLKGSAGTLGLSDLANLAHELEDILAPHQQALRPLPTDTTDALLRSLDALLSRARAHAEALSAPGPSAAPMAASEAGPPAAGEEPGGAYRVGADQIARLGREMDRLREVPLRLEERRRQVDAAVAALSDLPRKGPADLLRALLALRASLTVDGAESALSVESLEQAVREICTQPVRLLAEPLRRSVRDLCRAAGKEARLSVVGEELGLDRRILDQLRGPLAHLVRNAVDHGIEPPDVRQARGKHPEGALVLRFEQQGNMTFIEVADDGAGLDPERIRRTAIERGAGSAAELAELSPSALLALIVTPGFSTAERLSGTSGRGVGLDVVHTQVQALSGRLDVESVVGQGTRFLITLPAALGISKVMVVRAEGAEFGLPMLAIARVLPARPEGMREGRGGMRVEDRGRALPLRDLGALLGLRAARMPVPGQPLLVVESQGEALALAVDAVAGDRELLIRPLPLELRALPAYQGGASASGGEVLLVLRPEWVVRAAAQAAPRPEGRRALVVDDSITARALHRAMLQAGGFVVHGAASAELALEQLRNARYDIVVADVTLGAMSGLGLTRALRERSETRETPVILVSARDADEDRAACLASGADAFLSKRECASGKLLDEVASAIARRGRAP